MKTFWNLPRPVKVAILFLLSVYLASPFLHFAIFAILTGMLVLAGIAMSVITILAYANLSKADREAVRNGKISFWDHA